MEVPLPLSGAPSDCNSPNAPDHSDQLGDHQWLPNPCTRIMKGSLMGELDRDMGKLEAQVATLTDNVAKMSEDLRQLREEFAQVRGGWKAVIGLAALAGGALSWVTTYFFKH